MFQELRLAARSLFRRPAFSLVVIVTLGLGFGANAVILAVADAVLLRPLPYPDGDRLLSLFETVDRGHVTERRTFSYPDYRAVRQEVSAFEAIAAWERESLVLEDARGAERVASMWTVSAYFDVLGIEPALGRVFEPESGAEDGTEADAGAAVPEVVLSNAFWQSRFGGDPDVLGSTLQVADDPYTVIGVMPRGFGEDDGLDLWLPLLTFGPETLDHSDNRRYGVFARLAAGASPEQARQQVDAVFARRAEAFPESNLGYGGGLETLRRARVGDLRQPVLMLFGAVGLLLLIACANVANMLLAESLRRRRPAAIRLALGAGPWHLFRGVLLETLLLGAAGAALGVLLAAWGLPLLDRLSPVRLPSWAATDINLRVVVSTLGGVLVIGGVLAALTAWQGSGPALRTVKSGCRTVAGEAGGQRLRQLLLVGQIAFAFTVAAGALLLARSWQELNRIDPGFGAREMVVFSVNLPAAEREALPARGRELLDAVRAVPGVESASLTTDAPLEGGYSALVVTAEGAEPRPGEAYGGGYRAYRHVVDHHFFETLELPLVRGRGFEATDHEDSLPVAVISRHLAERLWPGVEDPIGRRFTFGAPQDDYDTEALWMTVVGIAPEVRYRTLRPDPERIAEDPDLYLSLGQFPRANLTCMARVASTGAALADLRQAVEPLHASSPIYAWSTLEDFLARQLRTNRFSTLMMGLFAALSLLLAAVGIYGVFSHRMGERRREIGIRMALGADRGRVILLVLRDALVVIALGLAGGWLAALAAGDALGDLLYGVGKDDLGLFTVVALGVLALGLGASFLPARQASRVDPQVVLREW